MKVFARKPSASMTVAIAALILAASGTAVAAGGLVNGDTLIKKHSLSGNRLRNHTITGQQVNLNKLGKVPSAKNADHATTANSATNAAEASHASNSDRLQGSGASAFFPASKVQTFNVKLAFGQTKTLFSAGTLTFSAKCVQNGTSPGGSTGQDFSELLVSTSQNGAIFSDGSAHAGFQGTNSTDFLNTTTAEANRAVAWDNAATGNSYGSIEGNDSGYGMEAVDPHGVAVIFPDGLTGAVNLFGSNCLLAGFAIIP